MTSNFKRDNFKPFKNKIFNNTSFKFDFKSIITGYDHSGVPIVKYDLPSNTIKSCTAGTPSLQIPCTSKILPIIPTIYFISEDKQFRDSSGNSSKVLNDNIGSTIINNYYTIVRYLKRLEIIKKFIIATLDSSKYYLNKKISRERYNLFEKKLIFSFKDDVNETFTKQKEFVDFIDSFIKNNFSILNNNYKDIPNFMTIFQAEFHETSDINNSKTFFINLFKKYNDIRSKIIKYIVSDYGILAFHLFFDVSKTKEYEKVKYLESLKKNSKNKDKIPDESKYLLYGNRKIKNSNFNNKDLSIGNVIESTVVPSSLPSKAIITKINFISSPETPYNIKNLNPPEESFSLTENNFISKNYKRIKDTSGKNLKITDRSMVNKIHDFDLLYTNVLNQQYYKDEHSKNINHYYKELKKSIENYIGDNAKSDIFSVISTSLENDFCLIQFIFNYVNPVIFNNAVDNHYKIKEYISKKINDFEEYYDQYIDWYNNFIGATVFFDNYGVTDESDFKSFFDKIFSKNIENL